MTPTNPQQEAQTSEARHTPGPWEANQYFHVSALGRDIADIRIVVGNGYVRDTAERTANARLVAAAPELLAALKVAESHIAELREAWQRGAISEHDGQGGTRSNRNVDVHSAIWEAIAKAEKQP